jgi:hypothetical protein
VDQDRAQPSKQTNDDGDRRCCGRLDLLELNGEDQHQADIRGAIKVGSVSRQHCCSRGASEDHFSSFALRLRFRRCLALGASGFFGGRADSAVRAISASAAVLLFRSTRGWGCVCGLSKCQQGSRQGQAKHYAGRDNLTDAHRRG